MDVRYAGIAEVTDVAPVAVVIDVMRAFTVTAWAFDRGAEKVVLAASLEEALELKGGHPDWVTLKDGPPAAGFDTVNSPGMLASMDLTGRTVVQKTTNGTVGVHAAKGAELLLCASFVVAEATARALRAHGGDQVTFVVTGGAGRAEEDLACAQYIAGRAAGTETDPAAFIARAAGSRAAADIADGVRQGLPGVHADDVALCLETDRFPFAMAVAPEGPLMVLRPVRISAQA
ncbi:putative 2-phosphosulfolactate phosphatase [Actinoplanes ianthinogenes]|uniref:Probable 2-phosphosulfolactate phosphatase n=1 Tax=Actinoplanes ianthinogenes TaxID=122358 RepID=A0ABN6CPE0_9ACTN|nr:2-phosphosulfolactate phosphatase [Actinoplanes ianthinogenes]BCJ47085.1 putative 2-phosphosulfolactate phosphatase [Actinoplanes ianthinogenes]GGR51581.1 putative 2-phosphosulfolactate phosphatase [Actinoplanes ianthinogenes]